MTVLVTGAAGFIGFHLSRRLLDQGRDVIGIDNLNSYYDVALKKARLERLTAIPNFTFHECDIADREAIAAVERAHSSITHIVNLAAQAGVRYSLENPRAYIRTNIVGFLEILELARRLPRLEHLVYASSSSVYGGNEKLPFSVEDRTDTPVSLYGATKKSNELMAHSYSHLFGIPATGLRFFTVYGPWGRPDMSAYIFTRSIFGGIPIPLFNNGDMGRDFTFIDDIVSGALACLAGPPTGVGDRPPHRIYNIGNHRKEDLIEFVRTIEKACGRKAIIELRPMQQGDVRETYADITAIARDFAFNPSTTIQEGIPRFVEWFRQYHEV